MRRAAVVTLAVLTVAGTGYGAGPTRNPRVFSAGEELRYAVRWQFLRLGTLIVRTECDSTSRTSLEARVSLEVESNPDLGFISLREFNQSTMNTATLYSTGFSARHTNGDESTTISRTYDPVRGVMTYAVADARTRRPMVVDTVRQCGPYVEGPSLLFHTRAIGRSLGEFNVPTCVNEKVSNTVLNFSGEIEEVEIDAVRNPVRTRYFTGYAEWTGASTAGVSGAFAGWLSDDEASVPIRAELQVILGSITLELESWRRPGWIPPTGLTAENR